MNYKNISLFGLLLLTAQTCFTIDYRTIGRRTFKTLSGIILVPAIVREGQEFPSTKVDIANHEAAHAVIAEKTKLPIISAQIIYGTIGSFKVLQGGFVLTDNSTVSSLADVQNLCKNRIKLAAAGVIQDAKDTSRFTLLNAVEQELHLPITKQPIDNNSKFNYFLDNRRYLMDIPVAVNAGDIISNIKLQQDNENNQATGYEIMRKNFMAAIPLVDQYQPEIKRVAEALEEKEYLTGDEIKKLVYPEQQA